MICFKISAEKIVGIRIYEILYYGRVMTILYIFLSPLTHGAQGIEPCEVTEVWDSQHVCVVDSLEMRRSEINIL